MPTRPVTDSTTSTQIPSEHELDLAEGVTYLIDEHGSLPLLQALQAEFQRRADLLSAAWQPLADDLASVIVDEQRRRAYVTPLEEGIR